MLAPCLAQSAADPLDALPARRLAESGVAGTEDDELCMAEVESRDLRSREHAIAA